MSEKLLQVAEHALKAAQAKGAKDVSAAVGETHFTSLAYREKKLEQIKASTSAALTLKIYINGRYSANTTSDLRPQAVEAFCTDLVAMTKMLAADPARALPDPKYYQNRSEQDLQIFDPAHAALQLEDRQKFARSVEDAALSASDKIISVTSTFYDQNSHSVQLHSNGFRGQKQATSFWAGADVSVQGQGDRKPSDWWWAGARHRADLPEAVEIGRKAALLAMDHIGAHKVPSERMSLVVQNRAAGTLMGHLLKTMTGAALQQKRSCLDGKIGQQVSSAKLNLTDDPFIAKGFGSRLYDSQGISAKAWPLFVDGVLKNYYIDAYYARKLSMQPTTASRSNIVFGKGEGDQDSIVKGIKKGILVTSFIGGNSAPATGDFSLGLRGHLIEDGKLTQPVDEMNITDNLLKFFPRLSAVGADPYLYSRMLAPTLCFDDVQFSGA